MVAGIVEPDRAVRTKVLVVEDVDHFRRMLADMLELDGFEVVGETPSGSEALELCLATGPDVIVMDYKVAGLNGISAARQIRAIRPAQPIILYTAYLDAALETRAKEAGVALCLRKDEGLNELERNIKELSHYGSGGVFNSS
jgi:CheY-like chemotaxis protein